jgi:hypothetical protein
MNSRERLMTRSAWNACAEFGRLFASTVVQVIRLMGTEKHEQSDHGSRDRDWVARRQLPECAPVARRLRQSSWIAPAWKRQCVDPGSEKSKHGRKDNDGGEHREGGGDDPAVPHRAEKAGSSRSKVRAKGR